MDRVPLARRRRLRTFLLFVVAPAIAVVPVALAYAAVGPPEGPTIAFTGSSTEPLVCGTRPSVTAMQIRTGTKIIIANQTKVATAAQVNGETAMNLAPGAGAVLRLKKGQHEIRLVPECVVVTEMVVVVISVVPGEPLDETPAPPTKAAPPGVLNAPSGPGPGAANDQAGQADDARPPARNPAATASSTSTSPVVIATTTSTASAEPAVAAANESQSDRARESAVIDVRPITFGDATDPKRGRLLAVIAAICVFGVTAAIIRAIVSQRTSTAVSL